MTNRTGAPSRYRVALAPLFAVAALLVGAGESHAQAILIGDKFVPTWVRPDDVITFSSPKHWSRSMIYEVRPDGSHLSDFFKQEGTVTGFTPDGRRLMQFRPPGAGSTVVRSIRRDGTGLHQLTSGPNESAPTSSPDGSRIAYVVRRDGRGQIQVMNADGSEPHNLSTSATTSDEGYLSWSPDGQWIAFNTGIGYQREIAVMHPDGTGRRQLTSHGRAFHPAFSPDGKRIAYTANLTDARPPVESDNRIFIMNADGTGSHQVGDISPIHGGTSWSPDGRELTFNAFGRLRGSELNIEIYTIDVDGAHLRQLTTQPEQPVIVALQTEGIPAARRLMTELQTKDIIADAFSDVAMRRLANQYLKAKTYDKAIAALTFNAETYGAENPDAWTDLGEGYKESGDRENAARCIRKALSLNIAAADRNRAMKLLDELGVKP